jgi:riboflavin kinase/FMN adenylyltransferase
VKVYHDALRAGADLPGSCVTIGNFDGLHVGHRAVVARARELGRELGAPTLVVTFRPHPAAVLSDAGAPERLVSEDQQRELFESAGVDGVLYQPFDRELARQEAETFYRGFLRQRLGVRGLVVGAGFRFGARRTGDVPLLQRLAAADGASGPVVVGVEPVEAGGDVVSSSRLRTLVSAGRVTEAEALLGRPFTLDGVVVQGEGRGRELGFPTANVEPRGGMIPGTGVYACALRWDEQLLGAVANVGRRPTFGARAVGVEAHVLDFAGQLYGAPVRLAFLRRIRDEQRFAGAEDLVARVRSDVAEARDVLAARPPATLRGVPGC